MESITLPTIPPMPILQETAEEIYQRWVNRANEMAKKRGVAPPATAEGEDFYDMWFPIAQEWEENQALWTYGFLQAFPIWADGEFLEAHAYTFGLIKQPTDDDESLRSKILNRAFIEEGNGRARDYEIWAKEIDGVGDAVAIEKARHDNSIDLYLIDRDGQPVTPEFASTVKDWLWEEKRVAGHDLATYPAPIFTLTIEATLETTEDLDLVANRIKERVLTYARGRKTLVYKYVAALILVDIGETYTSFTMNGGTEDVEVPPVSILQVEVQLS